MAASEIRELLKLLDRPDIISFAGGIPDPTLFPLAAITDAHRRALADPQALQYSASEGYAPLRAWIAGYMNGLSVRCTAEHVLITSGSQQALDFIAKLFVSPGDEVLLAKPTYLGALQAMSAYEPRFGLLPRRGDNVDATTGSVRKALGYVMPDFQNPTGTSLDLAERHDLLTAAGSLDLPLVEDAAYEALRYDGEALPSLLAIDAAQAGGVDAARVLYCGSFSKTVVPGLRLGWVVAPSPVIRRLVLIKQASDLHTSTLGQMVMHDVVQATMPNALVPIRAAYRARRDAMLRALAQEMPADVTWTKPLGGMFVWVTVPTAIDAHALLERALAEERIAFVPGRAFHADGSGANTLRLNFSLTSEARIVEGIGRLGALLRRVG
ncbi:MAG TPA: PLP-dependent aminotransferase family protein [Stellaceae bacterium]|nr:PLP-dependent aminotransferase family protein [Stellaceae bacterium]